MYLLKYLFVSSKGKREVSIYLILVVVDIVLLESGYDVPKYQYNNTLKSRDTW